MSKPSPKPKARVRSDEKPAREMDSFHAFLLDQLSGLPGVTLRRMFGGAGLYRDGVMFGLVADTLYLKVDDRNRADFTAAGMGPFVYEAKGKPMSMGYFQVPPEVLEDAERLVPWAEKALAVALAARAQAPVRKPAARATAKRRDA